MNETKMIREPGKDPPLLYRCLLQGQVHLERRFTLSVYHSFIFSFAPVKSLTALVLLLFCTLTLSLFLRTLLTPKNLPSFLQKGVLPCKIEVGFEVLNQNSPSISFSKVPFPRH